MPDIRATIAVAQMDCVVADLDANLNKIEAYAGLAKMLGAELVIFPECATTGSFIGDRVDELADEPDGRATRRLGAIAKDKGLTLISGMYTKENGVLHNSQRYSVRTVHCWRPTTSSTFSRPNGPCVRPAITRSWWKHRSASSG